MNPKEFLFLVWYSLKSMVADLLSVLQTFKESRTWFFIAISLLFVGAYYQNFTLIKVALPAALILYIVRKRLEPGYDKAIRRRAFLSGDEAKMMEYYDKDRRARYFAKQKFITFEEFKKQELKKIKGKRNIE